MKNLNTMSPQPESHFRLMRHLMLHCAMQKIMPQSEKPNAEVLSSS